MSNALARLLDSRISERSARPDANELGTIQADLSLKLDRFKVPIPTGDYIVPRRFRVPSPMATTSSVEIGDHGSHTHTVPRPAELGGLAAGDRVLVAWVNDGSDCIVVDVL